MVLSFEKVKPSSKFRHHGGVGLHLAFDDQVRGPLLDNLHRPLDLLGLGMVDRAEVGEGEHGDPRFDIQHADLLGGQDGGFGQFLGGRVDGDGGVGQEVDALFEDHHVEAVHAGESLLFADDFQRRADGFGIVGVDTAQQGVGIAHADHHGAEMGARFAAQDAPGFGEGQPLALAQTGRVPRRIVRSVPSRPGR